MIIEDMSEKIYNPFTILIIASFIWLKQPSKLDGGPLDTSVKK